MTSLPPNITESPYDYCKTSANSMLAIQEACDYKSHLSGCVHGQPQPTALGFIVFELLCLATTHHPRWHLPKLMGNLRQLKIFSGSSFSISFQSDMMMETVSWPLLSNYAVSFHIPVCKVVHPKQQLWTCPNLRAKKLSSNRLLDWSQWS